MYASFFLYVGDNPHLQQRYQPILALAPVFSGLMLDLFERANAFVEHVNEDQPLAFQHLKKLVNSWRQKLRQEEADALSSSSNQHEK
jgi:hypothetical protein